MYVTLDQVILVKDKTKTRDGDPVVFVRELRGRAVLTTDGGASKHAGPAVKYGVLYFDTRDRMCIVPDVWSEDDARLAKTVAE